MRTALHRAQARNGARRYSAGRAHALQARAGGAPERQYGDGGGGVCAAHQRRALRKPTPKRHLCAGTDAKRRRGHRGKTACALEFRHGRGGRGTFSVCHMGAADARGAQRTERNAAAFRRSSGRTGASPGDRGLSASHAWDGCAAGCHRPRRGHGGAGFRIGCADRAGTPFCGGGPRLFACAAHSGGQRRADCADAAFRRGHRRARTVSKRRRRGLRYPDPSISDGRGDAARPAGSAAALGARDGRLYFRGRLRQ